LIESRYPGRSRQAPQIILLRRVRGIEALCGIDASAMLEIIGSHTAVPTIMIGG